MSLSSQTALKGALLAVSLFGAVPYAVAILCNLMYGWPQGKNKYRRALDPRKVYAMNYAVLQSLSDVRHAKLYLQWNWFYWTATPDQLVKEIHFGSSDTKLDLYYPSKGKAAIDSPCPVVVFVYGGAWSSGSKNMYGLLCSQIADKLNALVLAPDYSKYPKGYADDMMQDIVDCLAWIQENIENYKGNKDQVLLIGHSAGAHLCFMSIFELLLRCQSEESPPISPSAAMRQLSSSSGNGIRFEEKYFDGSNGDSSDNNKPDDSEQFADNSGSFLLVEGEQKNEQSMDESQNLRSLVESVVTDNATASGEKEDSEQPESKSTGSIYFVKEEDLQDEPVLSRRVHLKEEAGGIPVEEQMFLSESKMERSSSVAASFLGSVKAIIGLAGVYSISDHFDHEYYRGVEDISAMARAMYGPNHFDRLSPTLTVSQFKHGASLPMAVLVHGDADTIVPVSSSTKFADAMSQLSGSDVTVHVIPKCNHTDVVLDLMVPDRKYYNTIMTIIVETAEQAFQTRAVSQ
ncbi:probable isoprenylcysteine alpha-carbonyl methylesterase ICMEL2 [Lingula anatina]|uniref:Probable isoprenylcysteine alpha-carbonyl methylesterase ICMEL2 n=1 Tax=Lingula anatina TaxID=7574 RepID=A0A1S3I083_LINAN|nr:probable isoprenylcysteine alpha-carbonyl methylesterase ICMEL2 [Lingula anatina]|eukprot:XP_013391668.1 probable isoprenylcysteine alpha-carbonyl methylesterase ICMEL2 [Lingula anatina]